jgi:hypothetical protein
LAILKAEFTDDFDSEFHHNLIRSPKSPHQSPACDVSMKNLELELRMDQNSMKLYLETSRQVPDLTRNESNVGATLVQKHSLEKML